MLRLLSDRLCSAGAESTRYDGFKPAAPGTLWEYQFTPNQVCKGQRKQRCLFCLQPTAACVIAAGTVVKGYQPPPSSPSDRMLLLPPIVAAVITHCCVQTYALYPQLANASPFFLTSEESDSIAYNKDAKKGPVFQTPRNDYQDTYKFGSRNSKDRKQYDTGEPADVSHLGGFVCPWLLCMGPQQTHCQPCGCCLHCKHTTTRHTLHNKHCFILLVLASNLTC